MSKPSIPGVLGILNNENKEHFLNMPFRTLTESKKKKKVGILKVVGEIKADLFREDWQLNFLKKQWKLETFIFNILEEYTYQTGILYPVNILSEK